MTATTIEQLSSHSTHDTLKDAYDWANTLINKGLRVQQCVICEDRFKSARPRGRNSRIFQIFGVTWGAEKRVKSIEPNGQWRVEIESPGTVYWRGADIFTRQCKTSHHRMSIWYSRFLPYAEAMVFGEQGWEQAGIDYDSINSYYRTCLGFCELGNGDGYWNPDDGPEYNRIESDDVELFQAIYHASMRLRSPGLPWDEAFQPCYVYLALHKPQTVLDSFGPEHWLYSHVREVCEEIDKPVPAGF